MAANLDKAESSLTAVSDVAYIRAIDSSGNSVRISKANLASVLGGVAIQIDSNNNLNDCTLRGVCYTWSASTPINAPYDTGSMMNILGGGYNGANQLQVCMQRNSANVKLKVRYKEANTWGNWLSIETA